jgi:hypothetical protein
MIHREKEDEFLEFDYDNFVADQLMAQQDEDDYDNYEGEDDLSDSFDDFDNAVMETDFSEIRGKSYKRSLGKANRKIQAKQNTRRVKRTLAKKPLKRFAKKPLTNKIPVKDGVHTLKGKRAAKISNVIVPSSQKVIVKGVSKFILSQQNESTKRISYYKGKKLKELNIIINNLGATDFTFNLFDPSMPLDYLYATGDNLNNRIQIAGGEVSYSDVLFNLLANPAMILRAQLNIAGASVAQQGSQSIFIYDKSITGEQEICPYNLSLQIDNMQVFSDVVYFDVSKTIKRPYIPDGMDVMKYTVLAGNSVSFTFFYTQVTLKKFFYKQARVKKNVK